MGRDEIFPEIYGFLEILYMSVPFSDFFLLVNLTS